MKFESRDVLALIDYFLDDLRLFCPDICFAFDNFEVVARENIHAEGERRRRHRQASRLLEYENPDKTHAFSIYDVPKKTVTIFLETKRRLDFSVASMLHEIGHLFFLGFPLSRKMQEVFASSFSMDMTLIFSDCILSNGEFNGRSFQLEVSKRVAWYVGKALDYVEEHGANYEIMNP